jgi:DNA-binding Lrp family transcriptional regulator
LDELESRLLDAAQTDFPIDERPFLRLAERLGCDEHAVIRAFARLQRAGTVRSLSAFFDPRRIGYASTLACMSVPPKRVDEVAALMAQMPEITHNYLRDHEWNVWFTVIAPSREAIQRLLGDLERRTGLAPIHDLPAQRLLKLRVRFGADGASHSAPRRSGFQPDSELDDDDWSVIEALQKGLPLVERPFVPPAEQAGMPETEFLSRVRRLIEPGVIRRLGPRVRHHRVGVRGNIMAVWRVPEDRLDEVAPVFVASPNVSHCYLRPAFEGFPYNLYTMVHAADTPAAERVIAQLAEQSRVAEYLMLHTVRELKKSTPVYRRPAPLTPTLSQEGEGEERPHPGRHPRGEGERRPKDDDHDNC